MKMKPDLSHSCNGIVVLLDNNAHWSKYIFKMQYFFQLKKRMTFIRVKI